MFDISAAVPDAPINVTAEEILDSNRNDDSCKLLIYLRPPSNIDENYIKHYFVQFPSGHQNISGAGCIVVVRNCNQDVRLNVSAVNTCNTLGASVSDIEPMFIIRESTTSAPAVADDSDGFNQTTTDSESSSTLASTTLCAVLLVISVLSS